MHTKVWKKHFFDTLTIFGTIFAPIDTVCDFAHSLKHYKNRGERGKTSWTNFD